MKLHLVLALIAAAALAQDVAKPKSADELWARIQELQQPPKTQPQSQEEMQKAVAEMVTQLEPVVTEFVKAYPADARSWQARMLLAQLAMHRAGTDKAGNAQADAERLLAEVGAAEAAPAELRTAAKIGLLQVHAGPVAQTPSKEALERMDKEITAFVKDTTEARAVTYAKVMRVQLYGRWNDPQAEPVLKELAADKDPAVAKMAAQQIAARERARKPVELKFTALDGAEVDVAKLRGKVVLVDFWATWCGPCRAELPNVLATYQKYHDKGFEIIGISLDEDKDKLTAFLKDKGMAWPQHFDGKGWQNEVSSANGINSIPAMWVLDKKGMIRSENARGVELDALVAKLLAE